MYFPLHISLSKGAYLVAMRVDHKISGFEQKIDLTDKKLLVFRGTAEKPLCKLHPH